MIKTSCRSNFDVVFIYQERRKLNLCGSHESIGKEKIFLIETCECLMLRKLD